MMESNAKSPFLWELENMVMFNAKPGESPKTLQLVESEMEGIEAFEAASFYSSGTGSDLGYASSSRSSKTPSDHSSTDPEVKETDISLKDLGRKKRELAESEAASGESLTALELCNRTYFEEKSWAGDAKMTDFSGKKSKSSSASLEIPRCQVEGCNANLSSAKDYHRKHRVCESHAKTPLVVINGLERRFCQQCSRFHSLSEFDQKKRSCRRRLSDHNARRRKPKPEVIQFNSMRMAASLYEGRNQLNFGFNQAPMLQTRQQAVHGKSSGLFSHVKSELQTPVTKIAPVPTHPFPFKGNGSGSSEVYHRGIPGSVGPTNIDAGQDLRALSLLSTSTWGSCNPLPTPLDHHNLPSFPVMDPVPPISSDFWMSDQQSGSGSGHGSQTPPSFQLFKAPDETGFYHHY